MLKFKNILIFFMMMLQINSLAFAKKNLSPEGYWTVMSEKTNIPRAIIQLIKRHGKIEGRIIRVYEQKSDHDYCVHCPPPFRNKPIIGLKFLWDLKSDGYLFWSGGRVLQPLSGKIYRFKMTMDEAGKQLEVRGYWGISIFGKTQIWVRRNKPE